MNQTVIAKADSVTSKGIVKSNLVRHVLCQAIALLKIVFLEVANQQQPAPHVPEVAHTIRSANIANQIIVAVAHVQRCLWATVAPRILVVLRVLKVNKLSAQPRACAKLI
jgi:hypothetical protein